MASSSRGPHTPTARSRRPAATPPPPHAINAGRPCAPVSAARVYLLCVRGLLLHGSVQILFPLGFCFAFFLFLAILVFFVFFFLPFFLLDWLGLLFPLFLALSSPPPCLPQLPLFPCLQPSSMLSMRWACGHQAKVESCGGQVRSG